MKKIKADKFNQFEITLLKMLLDGDIPGLKILRNQFENALPTVREYSGVGVFTNIKVLNNSERINKDEFHIGDVYFDLEGINHGGGAILFIKNGQIELLECYLNAGEKWPEDINLKRIYYDKNPRDLEYIGKILG